MKKIFSLLVRIGISVGVICFLFYTIRHQKEAILASLVHLPRIALLQVSGLYFGVMVFMSLRLCSLFRGQKIYLGQLECLRLTFIGAFFNNFLPTGAGGDIIKSYIAAKQTQKGTESVISIMMDRIIGFVVLILLASFSGIVLTGGPIHVPEPVLKASYFLLLFTFFSIAFFFIPSFFKKLSSLARAVPFKKIQSLLLKIIQALDQYREQKNFLLKAVGFSFVMQLIFTASIYILSKELGSPLPYFLLVVLLPLIHIATVVPSINGLGIREGVLVYLLGGTIGIEKAFTIAFISTATLAFWSLTIGGGLYILFLLGIGGNKDDTKRVTRDISMSNVQELSSVGRR